MGIVFRQSIKTSLVVFTGALLGMLTVWLSTKYIAPQKYGFTKSLVTQTIVLSQVAILGLNSTMVIYIQKYTNNDARRKMLLTLCILVPVLFAIVASIPIYFVKPWVLHHFQPADVPYMDRYFLLLPVFCILFMLQVLLEQYLGTQMKVAMAAFMREVVLRAGIIVITLLYAFGHASFDFLVLGSVFVYLIPVVVYLVVAYKTSAFGFSLNVNAFSKAEYKEMAHFSWYHFLLSLSITLMGYLDALALPLYDHSGFNSAAVYSVVVFIISFMHLPSKAMMTPTVTVLAQAMANNDYPKAKDVFVRSSINVLLATTFMAVIIICNLGNAMQVLPPGYSQIGLIFLILFIGRYVDLATGLNDAILSITNYYKFSFYVSLVMIAVLFELIKYLVPIYGVYGAAGATCITVILFNVCKYLFVWKKIGMQPFSVNSVLVVFSGLVALAAGYLLPHFFSTKAHAHTFMDNVLVFADVALRSTVIVIVYMLMLYWLKPSADLREYIATVKKNKRLF